MNKNKLIYNELLRRYMKYVRKRNSLRAANKNLRRQGILTKHIENLKEKIIALRLSFGKGMVSAACLTGAMLLTPDASNAQGFKPVQTNPFGLASVSSDGYSNPTFCDLDNDGDLDMLSGEYYGDFYYYENTGTNSAPAFAAAQMNPFGLTANPSAYFSAPSFVDLDNDGDFDVMSVDYNNGDIVYYENTGTNIAPAFAALSVNPFSITAMGNSSLSKPTFADLDNDGDLDMMITDDGTNYIHYYENTGSVTVPAFAAPVYNPFGLTMNFDWSNTTFIDIDADGDFDLMVGDDYGNAQYYENTGTQMAPAFAAVQTNPFGLTQINDYAAFWFLDLDNDGDLDAIAGDDSGDFSYWDGCSPNTGTATITAVCNYTSPSGMYTWDATGMYNDTLTNVSGCDSVITIDLTINPVQEQVWDNQNVYVCTSGDMATVTLSGSQDGVNYFLRDETNDTLVDGPMLGDGSPVAFTTGSITAPMTYNVYAEKIVNTTGLTFDQSGNTKVDCGNDASVQLSGTQITLEAWIYPTSWVGINQGHVINKEFNGGAGSDFGYMIRVGDGGKVSFNVGDGNWDELVTTTTPLVLNTWQHVAATYNGTEMEIYVDGNLIATKSTTVNFTSPNNNLTIGGWAGGNGSVFDGNIDEVRVWSVSKTQNDIQAAMNNCLTGSETGLAAYYQFEDGTGSTTLTDLTANGNDGTLMNMDENADWGQGSTVCSSCDLELTQLVMVDVNTTDLTVTNNANVLTATQTGAAYQWLDCDDNNSVIAGETMQDYTATANGNYSVEITNNGCVDTTNCEAVTTVGLDENDFGSNFKIYPNPSDGIVNVDFGANSTEKTIKVLSPEGKEVFTQNIHKQLIAIDFADFPKGIYFIEISDGRHKSFHKIVKQ